MLMTLNLIITDADLRNLKRFENQERICPLTSDNIFRGMVYTMLATQETYKQQMKMYNRLLTLQLDTPAAILEWSGDVSNIVRGLKKYDYLLELAEWWPKSGVYEAIVEDVNNNRTQEFDIRNRLAKEASGISYKGASLVMNMCDYTESVVLDVWALRALVADNYPIRSYKYEPKEGKKKKNGKKNFKHTYLGRGIYFDRGVTAKKEYTTYEGFFRELTAKHNERSNYNFTPFDFRRLLWLKRTAWCNEFGNDIDQLILPFNNR